MALTLKRTSLVAQVADALRSEILGGAWLEWIPGERELSQTLHVSRNTCHFALRTLYKEGLIEAIQGRGIRVKRGARVPRRPDPSRSVGMIIPGALGHLRPNQLILIEQLQEALYDMQVRLQLHSSPACYGADPRQALEKLVKKHRHNCWMLVMSQRPMQQWFMQRGLPCLVAGSIYPDIVLPSVAYDLRAIGRHAAGTLLSMGHRRLVFFNRSLRAAGDLESEAGFYEGVRTSSYKEIDARVVYHNDDLDSVSRLIKQMFASPRPPGRPTGLVIANPLCYLSAASALARSGFRVPEDVCLISRDDDFYLTYVDPEPARYLYDGPVFARKMMLVIRSLIDTGVAKYNSAYIVPPFTAGGSLRKL